MRPYPPLGLLSLSAWLKARGVAVEIFDATFRRRADFHRRLDEGPSVLGLYANLSMRASTLALVEAARRRGWLVVLGGPEPCGYPEAYLRAGADLVVLGEGERSLDELLEVLAGAGAFPGRGGRPVAPGRAVADGAGEGASAARRAFRRLRRGDGLAAIPGLAWLDDEGSMRRSVPRAPMADLDGLPVPDRDAVDLSAYLRAWKEAHGETSLNVSTARGCPFSCAWCSKLVFGQHHRRRSVSRVLDELEAIRRRWNPDQLWFVDDVFTLEGDWVLDYAEAVARRDLRIPYETISRADCLLDGTVLDALAASGCRRIWIGSESGSDRLLESMGRGVTAEEIRRATARCRERGIETGWFLLWGWLGETLADMEKTVAHVVEGAPDLYFTTVVHPMAGTAYHERLGDRLCRPDDWARITDRDLSVRDRPGRDWYALADRWLKASVKAARCRARGEDGAEAFDAEADEARRELVARG